MKPQRLSTNFMMILINKLIISNRFLRHTPFWWWYRLINHEGFRFHDYHIWTEFWYSINSGWCDMEFMLDCLDEGVDPRTLDMTGFVNEKLDELEGK